MSINEYDLDEYPFIAILSDDLKTVKDAKQLDVSDDEALNLAILVLEDPFFTRYLNDTIKEKLNSKNYDVVRAGLYSVRGFQWKIQRLLAEAESEPAEEPEPAKQTRVITPITDETRALALQLLESEASGVFPDRLRIMLSLRDENLVTQALEIAQDILKLRKGHRDEIAMIQSDRQVEIDDLNASHNLQVGELEKRIDILMAENTKLREQIPGWVIDGQRWWMRLKGKASRALAAAREDEPIMELPGHGGDPAPHLTVVEDEVVKAS